MRSLVCGGTGNLGRGILSKFKTAGWQTVNFDRAIKPGDPSDKTVDLIQNPVNHTDLDSSLKHYESLAGGGKFNVIVNAAGGFAMDNASNCMMNADKMYQMNLQSCFFTAWLAS